jgi:hypothetical protein
MGGGVQEEIADRVKLIVHDSRPIRIHRWAIDEGGL